MTGIYKIVSPSGRIYIGQSWDIFDRLRKYRSLRCKAQSKLYNSLLKYGFNEHIFEVVQEFPYDISQEVLNNYEFFYWKQYIEAGFGMLNIREAGESRKHSEETKQKFRERDHSYKLGKKQSSETIERRVAKIRGKKQKHKKGYVFTEEHRRNISEGRKNYLLSKKLQNGE